MSPRGYIPLGSDGKAERQGDKMENEIVWNHSLEHELIGLLKYIPTRFQLAMEMEKEMIVENSSAQELLRRSPAKCKKGTTTVSLTLYYRLLIP